MTTTTNPESFAPHEGGRGAPVAMALERRLAALARRLIGALLPRRRPAEGPRLRGYQPERHYLRGPGPACRARHGDAAHARGHSAVTGVTVDTVRFR